uniref:Uncharacterized protein n=2 Tax=Caenorhabditis japonica TaxID=281687 RepID=A0A8R1EBJ8_CAEJA
MFPSPLLQEAFLILETGKRMPDKENHKHIDSLSNEYRSASFEIQDEGNCNSKEFTVVVQPFATEYISVFVDVSLEFRKRIDCHGVLT